MYKVDMKYNKETRFPTGSFLPTYDQITPALFPTPSLVSLPVPIERRDRLVL